jgi:outer membrane protein assembly factor BamD
MRITMFSFFPSRRSARLAGLALAASLLSLPLAAQDALTPQAGAPGPNPPATATEGTPTQTPTVTLSNDKKSRKTDKDDRVKQTKDTRKENKKETHEKTLVGKDATLPDKQLYDKALTQEKSGHFDVARLDLQTLLNTYPDSQYLMRAKLAVADCWYKEGGAAALTQAEQEYNDFITFFPNAPEAAEAQMRIGDIYFKQMDVPDRDYQKATKAENAYRTMIRQYPDAPKNVREEATQKLREVQELLATREAEIAAFYATHENWVASIARYDTVIDSYPLYSHIDDAYIGKGDAYAAQAKVIRASATCVTGFKGPCLTEDAKARILQFDDGMAADAYRKVVLDHAAAPHVEDAKERLAALNRPRPPPPPPPRRRQIRRRRGWPDR